MNLPNKNPKSNINYSQTKPSLNKNKKSKRIKIVLAISLATFITLPAIPIAANKLATSDSNAPTAFISPLSDNQNWQDENIGSHKKVYQLNYYLSLSNSFANKATRLANDDPYQSEEERLIIINTLNKALKAANKAIKYYPNQPDAYLIRAQLYQKIAHLYPEAKQAAQRDLSIANSLMDQNPSQDNSKDSSQTPNLTAKDSNPLEYIPTEKASLAQNITIASPEENILRDQVQAQDLDTNAMAGIGKVKAGEKEAIIQTKLIKNSDTVYVLPKNNHNNHTLSVISKKQGFWFKVGIDSPPQEDLEFSWWIIPSEQPESHNQSQVTDFKKVS